MAAGYFGSPFADVAVVYALRRNALSFAPGFDSPGGTKARRRLKVVNSRSVLDSKVAFLWIDYWMNMARNSLSRDTLFLTMFESTDH